jgi:hypothetical protein
MCLSGRRWLEGCEATPVFGGRLAEFSPKIKKRYYVLEDAASRTGLRASSPAVSFR